MAASDKKEELNYDVILEGILQAENSGKAENQHLVMVIGQRGSGKSTTMNALSKKQMRLNDLGEVELVEPSEFPIGRSISSQTSIAKVALCEDVTAPGTKVAFAETPVFGENSSKEYDVVANGSIEMVLRRATGVKAFLIVIPWIHLQDAHVPSVMSLLKYLVLIFKNPVDMARNAVFLVNRCRIPPGEASYLLKHSLSATKDYYFQLAKEQHLSQPTSAQMYITMSAFLAVMQENLSRFVFFNPLDDGRSVQEVFQLINGIKTEKWGVVDGLISMLGSNGNNEITVKYFNCSECNDNRKAFNDGVYHGVSNGNAILVCIRSNIARCREVYSELARCETQIAAWQELLVNLREKQQNPDRDMHSKEYFHDLQRRLAETAKTLQQMMEEVESEIKEVESEKQQKTEELSKLDVDTPIVYEIGGSAGWANPLPLPYYVVKSYAPAGVEFVQEPKEECRNGKWFGKVYNPKKGIYENTFRPDDKRDWYYKWVTYIEKNKEPNNKMKIEELRCEITKLEETHQRLTSILNKLQEGVASFEKMIEMEEEKEKCSKEKLLDRLKEAKANIATYKTKIIDLKTENENCRNKGLGALQEFRKLQPKLAILADLPQYLEFNSAYVKNFSSDYIKFVGRVSEYQNYLESVDFRQDLAVPEIVGCNYRPADHADVLPLDPITQQPIKDPVCTEKGTVFDEISLIEQFDRTLSDIPPFMHRKEDGTIESISFMSWRRLQLKMPTRRHSEDMKLNGYASSSVEELERQCQDLAKELEAMRDNFVVKDTLLKKLRSEIERRKNASNPN